MMGSQTEAMSTARSPLQQVPQPSEPAAGSNGNGALVPRVILGIVCGLSLVSTVRSIIVSVFTFLPASFADAFDFVTFAASRFIDVLFPLVLAIPAIILLVYAIRMRVMSDRVALIMLALWWASWVFGLFVYLTWARDAVSQGTFTQLILKHLLSGLAPGVATACVHFIKRGKEAPARDSGLSGNADYASSPRIVLGVVVGIVLVGCAFGVLALVGSSMEQAQLVASGASGSEYLGSMVTDVVGIGLLAPAVPAILLMVFAARPTRSTRTAAIVGLVLWWALWVFAGFIMLPIQVGGIDTREALDLMWVFLALAIPPAVSTLCVYLASKGTKQGGVERRMMR